MAKRVQLSLNAHATVDIKSSHSTATSKDLSAPKERSQGEKLPQTNGNKLL